MLRLLLGRSKRTPETMGLIIESASPEVAELAFAKLDRVFPGMRFDLLTSSNRPAAGFREVFRERRSVGGLRLLFSRSTQYHLVVFFAAGQPHLRLCRAAALLLMRPDQFFAFNAFGDGFWVDRARLPIIRLHLVKRYERSWLGSLVRGLGRALSLAGKLPRAIVRFGRAIMAALFLLPALGFLAILRLCYDTSDHRFRLFGKTASAPRRDFSAEETRRVQSEVASSK